MTRKWISLAFLIVSFEIISYLMGLITHSQIDPWYFELVKPGLTPPNYIFGIVWSLLYALLAIVGWITFQLHNKKLVAIFSLQMIMNWAWTPLFFQLHWIGISFIWISTLTTINVMLLLAFRKQSRWLAIIILPYIVWLLFASYLNGMIWFLN